MFRLFSSKPAEKVVELSLKQREMRDSYAVDRSARVNRPAPICPVRLPITAPNTPAAPRPPKM